jgi:hypothetical protein
VFSVNEQPAPVPLHLAVCPECLTKVSRLREAFLLDRGAAAGVVDALPDAYWQRQSAEIMASVRSSDMSASGVQPFPFSVHGSFVRRPVLAFGSLAAALALVAGISLVVPGGKSVGPLASDRPHVAATTAAAGTAATSEVDTSDDELLRSVDSVLAEDPSLSSLVPEEIS